MKTRVLVLGTGGTIAGQTVGEAGSYTSGQVPVESLLQQLRYVEQSLEIRGEQIANIGSQDITAKVWRRLLDRIAAAFNNDEADAIMITHGTDTLEETGFLLDLTLPGVKPVVLVSAMRPANVIGSDGPRNLACGLRVAIAHSSAGRGVLAVSGDRIFAVKDLYKASTHGIDAFRSFPGAQIGTVTPGKLRYEMPQSEAPWRGTYRLPDDGLLPRVPIFYGCAAADPLDMEAVIDSGIAGIVVAGLGHGNLPGAVLDALVGAASDGLVVVRSSRVNEGAVTRNLEIDDDRFGFVSGGVLNPQKSRILMQLLLANGIKDRALQQAAFDQF